MIDVITRKSESGVKQTTLLVKVKRYTAQHVTVYSGYNIFDGEMGRTQFEEVRSCKTLRY